MDARAREEKVRNEQLNCDVVRAAWQPFVDSITSFAISLASGALLHGSLVSGAPVIDVLCASSLTSGLLNAA